MENFQLFQEIDAMNASDLSNTNIEMKNNQLSDDDSFLKYLFDSPNHDAMDGTGLNNTNEQQYDEVKVDWKEVDNDSSRDSGFSSGLGSSYSIPDPGHQMCDSDGAGSVRTQSPGEEQQDILANVVESTGLSEGFIRSDEPTTCTRPKTSDTLMSSVHSQPEERNEKRKRSSLQGHVNPDLVDNSDLSPPEEKKKKRTRATFTEEQDERLREEFDNSPTGQVSKQEARRLGEELGLEAKQVENKFKNLRAKKSAENVNLTGGVSSGPDLAAPNPSLHIPSHLPNQLRPHQQQHQEQQHGLNEEKERSQRTIWTREQCATLERVFESQQYLELPQRQRLALALNLTEYKVKIWFQNRRAKLREFQKKSKARPDQPLQNVQNVHPVQQLNVPSFVEQEMQSQSFYSTDGYQPNTYQIQPMMGMGQYQLQSVLDQNVQQMNGIIPQQQIVPNLLVMQPPAYPQLSFYNNEAYQPNAYKNQPMMGMGQYEVQSGQPTSNFQYSGLPIIISTPATVTSQMARKENSNMQPQLGDCVSRRPLTDVTNRQY